MAADSTAASYNEPELLETGPPSIKSASRRYLSKINEAAATRQAAARLLLDEHEDGMWRESKVTRKTRLEWEATPNAKSKEDTNEIGMGGVILDRELPAIFRTAGPSNGYWRWQVERQEAAMATTHTGTPIAEDIPLSNMGRFALLPPELRNRTYQLALVEADGPFTVVGKINSCSLGPCTHKNLSTTLPGILSSCRQIRHEAMPIFCAENTIKFDARTVLSRCTANFLRALGRYGSLISRMTLEIMVPQRAVHPPDFWQAQWPHEIRVDCSGSIPNFTVEIDAAIRTRSAEADQVLMHADKLNERAKSGERIEKLLLEFVWSDLMADLVFAAGKVLR